MTQSQTSSRRAPHTWQPMRLTPQVWPQIRKRGVSLVVGGRGLLSSRHTHLSTSERVNTARCLTSLNSLKVPAVMVTGWLVTGLKGSLHTFMMFYWYFSKFSYIFLMFLSTSMHTHIKATPKYFNALIILLSTSLYLQLKKKTEKIVKHIIFAFWCKNVNSVCYLPNKNKTILKF